MSLKHVIGRGLAIGRSALHRAVLNPVLRTAAQLRNLRPRQASYSSSLLLPSRYRYFRVSLSGLAAQLQRHIFRTASGTGSPRNRAVFLAFGLGMGLIEQQLDEDRKSSAACKEIQALFHKKMKKYENPFKCFSAGYKLEDYIIGQEIGKGCSAAVYEAAPANKAYTFANVYASEKQNTSAEKSEKDLVPVKFSSASIFPLAVKMMWNMGEDSSCESILKMMGKELVPASPHAMSADKRTVALKGHFGYQTKKLEPHPNVIKVFRAFTADVPLLPDAWESYPDMLPTRLNPTGIGHNRTLFLVMKKYPCTLRQYLDETIPPHREGVRMILQLLEGVDHLYKQGIAHRDLKSNNILMEYDSVGSIRLVITDFGCCLAESYWGLKLPFNSTCVDRGGNVSLMAPEVVSAVPGPCTFIDYSKADVWAVGAIAYEIFGRPNPFYKSGLESRTYQERELPALPQQMPPAVQLLVKLLLRRDPHKRPSARTAANMLHIYYWNEKQSFFNPAITNKTVDWLLCQCATAILQSRGYGGNTVEVELLSCFLANIDMAEFRTGIAYLEFCGQKTK
ncbi:serine/threonine-protein kinase PINK1, mitochondrial [Polypterus senegalus]|uniref:serine/threonine-protein kinase PINK1, mitochondrial n=1 Tax=Polypterus senegalus TaxID=55291 RepID=UPI001965BFE2|nr:serine/threonine-protein kinase PINK1, mitochondrial [Polypterus senegalus]